MLRKKLLPNLSKTVYAERETRDESEVLRIKWFVLIYNVERVINSKWDKATSINGIFPKIGCCPAMSSLPKATRVCPFRISSLHLPRLSSSSHAYYAYPLSSSLALPPLFLSLSLSPPRSLSPATVSLPLRSPPIKSYLVTARNMLCEPTYPFAFTYRSGAVPRTTEESRPATVETIENTPLRASRRRILKSSPRRRCSIAPPGIA